MRRFTLLALMAIITTPVFGYGSYSTERLNDDLYVDIFYETYCMEGEAEIAWVLEGYNITEEKFEAYTEGIIEDPARAEAVLEALYERDELAGAIFDVEIALSELKNYESWRYFTPELTKIPDDWDSFSDGEKQGWFAQEFAVLREQFLEWQQEIMSRDTAE